MENQYKIILFGDTKAGKASLLQLSGNQNEAVNNQYKIIFKSHKVNLMGQHIIKIFKIEKTGGNRLTMIQVMKRMNLVIVVYDVTNPNGLESAQRWINFIQENCQSQNIVIVANKIDKIEERVITQKQGLEFAQQNGLPYFETSSMDKTSVDLVLKSALQIIIHAKNKQQILQNPHLIEENIELGNKIIKYKQKIKINMILLSLLVTLVILIIPQINFTLIIDQFDLQKHYIIWAVGGVSVTLFFLCLTFQEFQGSLGKGGLELEANYIKIR